MFRGNRESLVDERQPDYFFFLAAFFLVAFFLVAFLAFFFAAMV
jgi:hypothetical protein